MPEPRLPPFAALARGANRGRTGDLLQGSGIAGQIAGNALVGRSLFTYNNRACYKILKPVKEAIKQQLITSPVICLDETAMRIEGTRKWCHVVSTRDLTYYSAHSWDNFDFGLNS